MAWTNKSKNTTSFTNRQFSAGQTIGDSDGTIGESDNRFVEGIAYKHKTKNTTTFTNKTKN